MAKYNVKTSKARNFAIGILNLIKEIVTFLFSLIIRVLELVGIILE